MQSNVIYRIVTLSKIRRAIKAIKYIWLAFKIFRTTVIPIIGSYIEQVKILIKDLKEMEKLKNE